MGTGSGSAGDLRYGFGFFTGVATSTIVLLVVLAIWWVPSYRGIFADMGEAALPNLTVVVLSDAWRFAAPLGLCAAVLLFNWPATGPGRRRLVGLVGVSLGGIAAVVMTVWGCYLPLFRLSAAV